MTPTRLPFLVKLHPSGFLVARTEAASLYPWVLLGVLDVYRGDVEEDDPHTFTDEQAAPWPDLAVVPRPGEGFVRMPEVVPPARYATESDPVYLERVFRWRQWLGGHADRWYAPTNEIKAFETWAASDPVGRAAPTVDASAGFDGVEVSPGRRAGVRVPPPDRPVTVTFAHDGGEVAT